jgi:hypothetical protein
MPPRLQPDSAPSPRAELSAVQYRVLKNITLEVARRSLPPLDERLKSIVASQIRTLLRGGYGVELVERVAIALALSHDERRGHGRLCHLAARVRSSDAGAAGSAHDRRKAAEQAPLAPRVAALIAPALASGRRPHPNEHAFVRGREANACAVCEGPIGVHVRLIALDDEGGATVVSTGLA